MDDKTLGAAPRAWALATADGRFRRERRGTTDECPRRDRFSRASRVTRLVSRGRARARGGTTDEVEEDVGGDRGDGVGRGDVRHADVRGERIDGTRAGGGDASAAGGFYVDFDVVRPIVEAVETRGRRGARVHAEVRRVEWT